MIKPILRFFLRIYEIVLFVPIIWNCYSWDYSSLLLIMEHWIGRMKLTHDNDIWHVDAHKYSKQLLICKNLLKRMSDENYGDSFYKEHDQRWGKAIFKHIPSTTHKGMYEFHSVRIGAVTDEQKALQRKELSRIYKHEEYLFKQDLSYFCKLFQKHLRHWWT